MKESGLRVGRVDHCEDEAPAPPNAWPPVELFSPGPCSPLWPEFSAFGAQLTPLLGLMSEGLVLHPWGCSRLLHNIIDLKLIVFAIQ